ncbi:MAG TPA: MBL fold metallo-hydrolase [Thermoanaerobaculia bacterium]|nr:MBL fold metallo-hydrolase [Thermoanaerobaculia bacterium]
MSSAPFTGFEVIGNATVIAWDDDVPVIATDPWLGGDAYFGSWVLSHAIPEVQQAAIRAANYIWFSHGHPDHLNPGSMEALHGRKVLLPDHVGGRIKRDLDAAGFETHVLTDRKWYPLSERVSVMSLADYNQDAVLLLNVNGRLVVNLNDSGAIGHVLFLKRIIRQFDLSVLTQLSGYGDADMINFFEETGERIPPPASRKDPVGAVIARRAEAFGVSYFIPSSSMHRYQREDSAWANEYTTHLSDYEIGFASKTARLLPAFVRFDCRTDTCTPLNPPENPSTLISPKEFGDDWTALLNTEDIASAEHYFRRVAHLGEQMDFVTLRVGGKDHPISLRKRGFEKGITFEVPAGSLRTALQYEIFDDLLIGNFMKTTLHGKWPPTKLYPDFTPYVAKYSDNGLARTKDELQQYFSIYRRRAPLDFLIDRMEQHSKNIIRGCFHEQSTVFNYLKKTYWRVRAAVG